MFERYTEKARRVIFFARYEASNIGGDSLDTPHLLLGLIREDKGLTRRLFGFPAGPAYDQFRAQVEKFAGGPKQGASVDMPLSEAAKRVLRVAEQEADALGHRYVGTEHLLLGLLAEKESFPGKLLAEHGFSLEQERQRLANELPDLRDAASGPEPAQPTRIHGGAWRAAYLNSVVALYRNFAWQRQAWKARDILVDRQTGRVMFYSGEQFDKSQFLLTRGGWNRDHCAICRWELTDGSIGYTNGRDWICTECYQKLLAPPITPLDDLYT